ncbi:MAG: 30S ribosomal protein S6 [Spirochaetaceae bacterium]
MRQYELTIIVGTEEDEATLGKQKVDEQLQKAQVNVKKDEDKGVRDLAYPIKKRQKGHYYYYEFEADPEKTPALEQELRLLNPLLKHLLVKKEQ